MFSSSAVIDMNLALNSMKSTSTQTSLTPDILQSMPPQPILNTHQPEIGLPMHTPTRMYVCMYFSTLRFYSVPVEIHSNAPRPHHTSILLLAVSADIGIIPYYTITYRRFGVHMASESPDANQWAVHMTTNTTFDKYITEQVRMYVCMYVC